MSDIRLIIEEAADVLTRNERKTKNKKDYTTKDLEEMLKMQGIEKDKNRTELSQKLLDLCEKAKKQFELSSIPTNMMQKIAIDIYNEIKVGNIKSVEAVEKNAVVTKTVQKEATKVQLIENYEAALDRREPVHTNIPYYSEETKLIVSSPEVASCLNAVNAITQVDKEVTRITSEMNVENADEVSVKLSNIMNTDEFKNQEFVRAVAAKKGLMKTDEPEEQRCFCEDIEHQELACRCRLNPTNGDDLVQLMFKQMTRANIKNAPIDRILADMKLNILSKELLTPEQRVQFNDLIDKKDIQNILIFLSERIVEINPNVTKEEVQKAAKEAAEVSLTPSRINKNLLKTQARIMYSDDREYLDYCDLANSIYEFSDIHNSIDWKKIDKLKDEYGDLYPMTLAALNGQTKKTEDKTTFEKVQGLIEEYAENNKITTRDDVLFIRIANSEKSNMESMYWTFADSINRNSNDLESIKKSRITQIKNSSLFTDEEKQEEIRRINQIQTVDDANEYIVEGIKREKVKAGLVIDEDKIRTRLNPNREKTIREKQREIQIEENTRENAKAKATTMNKEYYDRYIQTKQMLAHAKKNEEMHIDEELLDYLKNSDSAAYANLCEVYSNCSNASLRDEINKRVKKEQREELLQRRKLEKNVTEIEDVIKWVTDENTLMEVAESNQKGKIQEDDDKEL